MATTSLPVQASRGSGVLRSLSDATGEDPRQAYDLLGKEAREAVTEELTTGGHQELSLIDM